MVMRFLKLLFISTKSPVLSMFICNMLAVTQDLMSMRHFGCYWWLGVMISHCLAWRPSAAIRHEHEYGNLVAIAPSGAVYRVNNIGPSTKPWGTLKHRFRYDDRVPLITTDCFHRLKQDPNQSNAASLIANLCSRCSNMMCAIISNAADKSSRVRMSPQYVSIARRRSFCTLSRAVSVLWFCLYALCTLHSEIGDRV